MLLRLSVENFALFERSDIELAGGLNALTGETGAGKSLLLDALECVLGSRASSDLVRHGHETGLVEAFFQLDDAETVETLGRILGEELSDGELLIRRRLSRAGRFTAEVNGRSVPVSALRQAGDILVDIHGQNEHQRLIKSSVQLEALDRFAELGQPRKRYEAAYDELRERLDASKKLRAQGEELAREKEYLEHQVKEIASAGVTDENELESLIDRRQMAAHHQQIVDTVSELHGRLYEDDDSVMSTLERVGIKLSRIQGLSKDIDRWIALLEEAAVGIGEAGREAGQFLSSYDMSPGELERIDDRIATLKGLCRKYGPTLADSMAALAEKKTKLATLDEIDMRLDEADKASRQACEQAAKAGGELGKRRRAAAGKLAKKVQSELAQLGMEDAEFRIDFETLTDLHEPQEAAKASRSGLETCEYMLSPNPGEGWAALRKIASGGEVARAMLALKSVLAGADKTPVLVFDEIDSDIGGRLADAVGKKLREISAAHQVLVVTHLPQIAAFAERQFRVSKATQDDRTAAVVMALSHDERVSELAEMLRGREKASEAREQAEKMLTAGGNG